MAYDNRDSRRDNYSQGPNLHSGSSGAGIGVLAIIIALVFIVLPIMLTSSVAKKFIDVSSTAIVMMVGFGILMLLVGAIIITITRLYMRAPANMAFVRTGMGGKKAIVDGGAVVIPMVHEVTPVSLETMRLNVERVGKDALITGDNLRVDVEAEFFIRVDKETENIINAATSLGRKSCDAGAIQELVFDKLVSAIRTVAATRSLNELHTKRDSFAEAVKKIVEEDLHPNGLKLEAVTISRLDQTPTGELKAEQNVFDAQGARTIAEIIQKQRVERNQIEREADKQVEAQNVERDRFIFQQKVEREKAEAETNQQIQQAKSEADQKANTFAAEQKRLAELARVTQEQAVQVAEVDKTRAISVKEQERQQAEREAEIKKNRQLEIAEREKEIAVAAKEKERADAEALRLAAEKEREAAQQAVQTTTVTAEAERAKQKAVIDQQAESERNFIKEQKAADAKAYTIQKEAEGKKAAAEAEYDATVKAAEAQQKAKESNAAGLRAEQMVPVEVSAEQVKVEQSRVQVLQTELAAKAEHAAISKELEIALATINADKEARIAFAKALGEGLSNANMTIWGDPDTVGKISRAFTNGQMAGNFMSGLTESTPEKIQDMAKELTDATAGAISGLGQKVGSVLSQLAGIDLPAEDLLIIDRLLKKAQCGKAEAVTIDKA